MARACVFCSGTPTTREHVWPNWAAQLVRDAGPLEHRQHGFTQERGASTPRVWLQDPFTMTVKVVCADCNNGWMSRLEDRAKPLLFGMLHGRGRALHRGGQQTLAAWALKTALIGAHTQAGGGRLFPQRLHRHLHAHRQPPEDLHIWMTTYTGNHPGVYDLYGLDLDDRQDPSRGERDIYGATFSLGPVAFQVYGSKEPELVDIVRGWPWPNVFQIWPHVSSFIWAPSPALDNGALMAFAHAISDALLRERRRADRRGSAP